jgi:hypothetical protein
MLASQFENMSALMHYTLTSIIFNFFNELKIVLVDLIIIQNN